MMRLWAELPGLERQRHALDAAPAVRALQPVLPGVVVLLHDSAISNALD
jgi:hypothetical protein